MFSRDYPKNLYPQMEKGLLRVVRAPGRGFQILQV